MIKIRLVCVGNLKEKFWTEAQNEYIKRLSKFCKFELVELPEKNVYTSKNETKHKEGKLILQKLEGKTILFDVSGDGVSSEELAMLIEKSALSSSALTFVVGGSHGVSDEVKAAAEKSISFGKITLPHNLFRVVALEQIYRAFTIISGSNYHK